MPMKATNLSIMNKFYNVQSIEFNQEWMTLTLDIATYQIPIKQISKRLYIATDAERNFYTALLITVRDSRIPSLPCLPSLFCPRWIPKTL
jgi:hypothetical protein